MRVCVCVCVSTPEAINNQWRDIDRVRLVKQVLRLFPAFNYFIWQLPSIKWMGVAIYIYTARSKHLPKKTKVTRY